VLLASFHPELLLGSSVRFGVGAPYRPAQALLGFLLCSVRKAASQEVGAAKREQPLQGWVTKR